MKRNLLLYLTAVSFLVPVLSGCEKKIDTYPFDFQFITENYAPLNYEENDTLKGLGPDLLRTICTDLNIPFSVEVLPWDEGYEKVQADDHAVLFSTILNSTRKDLFKWAGPYASLDWLFYSSSVDRIDIATLDDAKKVGRIGVLEDYAITQYLIREGFENLVYCDDNIAAIDKLLKGEIDLFPSDKMTAEAALEILHQSIYSISPEMVIKTDLVYYAFNKEVPDEVVADFQGALDKQKTNGVLESLTRQYLHKSDFPATLQIYTEQYPPVTFRNSFGEITGFGSDIVYEIMRRNNQFYNIRLALWSIGYELALNNPNFCLFTMDRTPIRENLFQWVGPVGTNTTWFYTRAGSGVVINSIEDAKKLIAVGTVSSWFSTQYLIQLGFTNLVSDPDPGVMTRQLMSGAVDAFVCTGITFPDILKEAGFKYDEVSPAFALMSTDFYIAFSLTTPGTIVNQWQSSLDAMKQDGTYDAIHRKWLK